MHNHIGTVHAIALCNLAELSAGVMTDATIPASMRWIPKGMTVEYLKKATGTMRGVATPDIPAVESTAATTSRHRRRDRQCRRHGVPRTHRDVGIAQAVSLRCKTQNSNRTPCAAP